MFHTHNSTPTLNATDYQPLSWFFTLYIINHHLNAPLPSGLEILFLLDSGASISVLNVPTFTALADHFLKCSKDFANCSSKTLMVANKSQVPILTHVTLTCHTTIDNNSRTFVIPFAVANIK